MALRSDFDGGGAGLLGLVGQDVIDEDGDSVLRLERRGQPGLNPFGEYALGLQVEADLERHHHSFLALGAGGMLGLTVEYADAKRSEIDDAGDGTAVAVIDGDVDISSLGENLGAGHVHISLGRGLLADGGLETAVGAGHERSVLGTGARKDIFDGNLASQFDQDKVVDLLTVHAQCNLDGQITLEGQHGAVRREGQFDAVVEYLHTGENLVGVVSLGLPLGLVPGVTSVPGDVPDAFLDLQDRGPAVLAVHEVTVPVTVAQPVACPLVGLGIPPVPPSVLLVIIDGQDERLGIIAVLSVHAAEQIYLI